MRRSKAVRTRAKPAKQEVLVNKGGRPFAVKDKDEAIKILGGLGAIMATWKECAAVLGITEPTLMAVFKRWPETEDAYKSGKEGGKVSLRRAQFDTAKKGNATLLVFLGLNYLDQRDLRNVNHSGSVQHSVEHSIVGMMLKEIDEEQRGPVIEHRPGEGKAA